MLTKYDRVVASLKALHARDLDAALGHWHEEATIKLVGAPPGGPDAFDGKAQIRMWFDGLLAEGFEIQEEFIREDGDSVTVKAMTWSDVTRRLGVAPLVATEVYVFEGDKIRSLTWTISPESLAKLAAALPPA